MNEVTEHIFPTIGRNIEHYECPVLTGMAREEIIRCADCGKWGEPCDEIDGTPYGECREFSVPGRTCLTQANGFCFWADRKVSK